MLVSPAFGRNTFYVHLQHKIPIWFILPPLFVSKINTPCLLIRSQGLDFQKDLKCWNRSWITMNSCISLLESRVPYGLSQSCEVWFYFCFTGKELWLKAGYNPKNWVHVLVYISRFRSISSSWGLLSNINYILKSLGQGTARPFPCD